MNASSTNLQLTEAWQVANHIHKLHSRPEDFSEGDLLHRSSKFTHYERRLLPIASIDLNEFALDDDLVLSYARTFLDTGVCPEIVFDGVDRSMIDGLHRAVALDRCGETQILAFVGTERYLDPDFSAIEEDEEADFEIEEDEGADLEGGVDELGPRISGFS